MAFRDTAARFLGVPTQSEMQETKRQIEQLSETVKTQEKLLEVSATFADQISDMVTPQSQPSSLAREQHHKEDIQGLVLRRVPVKELQLLYLNNQFVFRGVNVRADELVTRGFSIITQDESIQKECMDLIRRSGGANLFWQLSVNTDVCGDGYLEKVPNDKGNKILLLKHVNAINFGFKVAKDNPNQIEVDASGMPTAYMQTVYDSEGKETKKIIAKEKIAHLRFNTFGDEFNGISSLQPVYSTSIRLMNMEQAAAEAAVKSANPVWIVNTTTKSPRELNMWASYLGRISGKEVVFLPDGLKVELKSPGNQNFSDYAGYFLDAVVAALGVPKSILTGGSDAGGGNRATVQTLSQHFYSIMRANQRYVEAVFNDDIFVDYAKRAGWSEVPKLAFNDIAEDADRNGQRAVELYKNGIITVTEARGMLGLDTREETIKELIPFEIASKSTTNIDPDAADKKADMKVWHGAEPGKVAGSQKGNKASQKIDANVPSVT